MATDLLTGLWHGPIHPDIHDRIWVVACAIREEYEFLLSRYRASEKTRIAFGNPGPGSALVKVLLSNSDLFLEAMHLNDELGKS